MLAPPVVTELKAFSVTPAPLKLEYFAAHGRGCQFRLFFDFTNTKFENNEVEFYPDFMTKKAEGFYTNG